MTMYKSRFSHVVLLRYVYLLLSTLPTFTFVSDVAASEIKIGVVMDQSSINSDVGRDYLAGARAFFDHHNSQAKANDKITLLVRDDEGAPAKAVEATRTLIERDRVDALFGFVGDESVAAVAQDAVFKRARIALYAPLSGDTVSAMPDTIFYVRPTYRAEARYLINHFNLLGNKDFLIVSTAAPAGDKLYAQIAEEVILKNLRSPLRVNIPADYKGLRDIAHRVHKLNPQVFILATDTITSAEFVKNFRPLDKGINIVALSAVNPRTLLELAKPEFAASTMFTQVVPHPDMPLSKVQIEHLQLMAKYRDEPPSHVTLEGFIAAKSFVNAITSAKANTRTTILAALTGERRFDVGGITLTFKSQDDRGSKFVELTFLRRSGKLIQ